MVVLEGDASFLPSVYRSDEEQLSMVLKMTMSLENNLRGKVVVGVREQEGTGEFLFASYLFEMQ